LDNKSQQLKSRVRDNWSCVREKVWCFLRKGLLES
jgi:hypothetical protein